jgi:hypothetical protein
MTSLYLSLFQQNVKEYYKENNINKAVCLLCYQPTTVWVDFLSKFESYDVYIIVDDNNIDCKSLFPNNKNINFIKILDQECYDHGFMDINFCINKKVTSWEKGLYYFSSLHTTYSYVWFFEDDVFFYNEMTLLGIDSKYEESDLISNVYSENKDGIISDWHWPRIVINQNPPYYCAMVCAVRMSTNMIICIKEYATKHNTLFFLEALFPTLCKSNHLKHDFALELSNIVYRKEYTTKDIEKINLYHPVKNIQQHIMFREYLEKKE